MTGWRRYDDDHPDRTGPRCNPHEPHPYWVVDADGEVIVGLYNDYVWTRVNGDDDFFDVEWWSEMQPPDGPC